MIAEIIFLSFNVSTSFSNSTFNFAEIAADDEIEERYSREKLQLCIEGLNEKEKELIIRQTASQKRHLPDFMSVRLSVRNNSCPCFLLHNGLYRLKIFPAVFLCHYK